MNSGDKILHYKVLDKKRKSLLIKLAEFKDNFYLAGGTALALQIGHRISEDFDFFTSKQFDNEGLLKEIVSLFASNDVSIVQNEKDTITIIIDNEIKISFFNLEYSNYLNLIETEHFYLAQIKEIGTMKLLALFRATFTCPAPFCGKDYVDIYFILQRFELKELIESAEKKHPNFDKTLYLKALISFDDIDDIPIQFIQGFERKREEIFSLIEQKVIEYIKGLE